MKPWAIVLCSLLLGGCASERPLAPLAPLLHDAAFAAPSTPVGAADLFALSPAMQAFLHSAEFAQQVRTKGPRHGLFDALYRKSDLRLEYDSERTRNAAEAFAARRGNCLSLVIMTAAFARAMGITVQYQQVQAGEHWSRKDNLLLASSHVNLSLDKPSVDPHRRWENPNTLVIDFLPSEDVNGYRTTELDEETIVALYMNNRAAEALLERHLDDAYWWTRAALLQAPKLAQSYNMLAVVYLRHGERTLAEQAFRVALERDPDNLGIMQNLASLLVTLGKDAEAQRLEQRIARLEPTPPFHYFNLGRAAMARADYPAAKALFEREVKRAPDNDEFHFWLALACLKLGEAAQADVQLALAHDASTTPALRERYSGKLERLRSLNPARSGTP
jgi:Tfp pilus assembly protein PilF